MINKADTVFINANIITVCDELPVIKNGYVSIKDGKIVNVSSESALGVEADEVIDCRGGILMPGLINTHAHTAMCLLRGYADDYSLQDWMHKKVFPAEARLDARCIEAGVTLGFAEMLKSGTTSISDMYFFQPTAAKVAENVGIRVSLSNGIMSFDEENYCLENDRAINETLELIRNWHGKANDRIRADVSIHAEYTSYPKLWRYVAQLARDNNLTMHVHVSETKREHVECFKKYGMTPLEALDKEGVFAGNAIAAHCVWVTDSDMELMAERKISVAHNPVSNLKLASGTADITRMKKHGINVSLGTDGCCSNNNHDMFEEMKLSVLLQKGKYFNPTIMTAYDAIKMATVNGAIAQGRYGQIGQIKTGLAADIIVLDAESLSMFPSFDPISSVVYGARGADVVLTMVDGKILYRNGEFSTVDISKAKQEISNYAVLRLMG